MPVPYNFRAASVSLIVLFALGISAVTAAPTGALNDTGQTRCLNTAGTALEACSEANSGDASTRPRQDGRFGRDPSGVNTGISGFGRPAVAVVAGSPSPRWMRVATPLPCPAIRPSHPPRPAASRTTSPT